MRPQSITLYKNHPALVVEVRDKIDIKLEDGSSLKVREKDLVLLAEGPVKDIPSPAEGGDFETARKMLAPQGGGEAAASLPWAELAELVFGEGGAAQALACWKEACEGRLFRIEEGLPYPMDDEAVAREAQKRARKEGEAAEKAAFIERAKRIRAERKKAREAAAPGDAAAATSFEEADGRFLSEIEALAYGKSEKSRTCAELGVAETAEAAQAFLLALGWWDESVNPHPYRAGCPLAAPKVAIGPDLDDLARTDLTAMSSWAIDNAWSKDPDDAIGWDGASVWVHVADPASAILPDSPADKEALGRGTTLYLPELTSPMLAEEALQRYGLGLGEEVGPGRGALSPALSFRIELAEDGSVAAVEAMASTVRVRRASYGEADRIIEAGEAPELAALAGIAAKRRARRLANGAVEIDIPEVNIRVAGEGRSREIAIEAVPEDRSSGIVREMMLLAGEAAARWAFERKLAFPFYGQESPSEMSDAAMGTGLSAQFARRRLMRAGMWGPGPSAHRGLGLPFYAQVTSPLRRYQDLLGHMQLRAYLAREAGLASRPVLDADEVSRRCALAQAASAATRAAERGSDQHWILAYLARRPLWTGEAIIVGGAGGGASQAYIPELGLETRLKLGPGRELDESIRIRLLRVDLAKLEADFEELRE